MFQPRYHRLLFYQRDVRKDLLHNCERSKENIAIWVMIFTFVKQPTKIKF